MLKFQHLKMYPNKILSKRTTATAWFYIIICFAWSFGCANNIIGFPGTNAFRCIVSEIRKKKWHFYITLPMYLQVYETYNNIIFELLNTLIHEFPMTNSEFLGISFVNSHLKVNWVKLGKLCEEFQAAEEQIT